MSTKCTMVQNYKHNISYSVEFYITDTIFTEEAFSYENVSYSGSFVYVSFP